MRANLKPSVCYCGMTCVELLHPVRLATDSSLCLRCCQQMLLKPEAVHYKSTVDALGGLFCGDVQGVFSRVCLAAPNVKAGKWVALGSTVATRTRFELSHGWLNLNFGFRPACHKGYAKGRWGEGELHEVYLLTQAS